MAANSKIEWTSHTFNPWVGCTKVSAGCANCYAERDFDTRRGRVKWGPNGTRSRTSDDNWKLPMRWNRKAACYETFDCGGGDHSDCCPQSIRPRVFCASLADVFEEWDGPIHNHQGSEMWYEPDPKTGRTDPLTMADLRRDLFALIDATPHLDWLLVTKRPENIRRMWVPPTCPFCESSPCDRLDECHSFAAMVHHNGKSPLYRPNVWLLTSVEDQQTADARVPELLKCRDLAPVLGLSCEPLLGPIDLRAVPRPDDAYFRHTGRAGVVSDPAESDDYVYWTSKAIDWVIAGGESGPHARPMHPDWARSLRYQCQAAGVPFFFKQHGEWLHESQDFCAIDMSRYNANPMAYSHEWPDSTFSIKVGKQAAGRLLDGVEHNEYPKP